MPLYVGTRYALLGVRAAAAGGAPPAVPDYGNPGGTGDRTGTITVTWDGTVGGSTVNQLVDGTQADEFWWTAGQTNKILKFDFGVGASKVINAFKWYQSAAINHGGSNQFAGSNDDAAWTNIGATFTLIGSTTGTEFTFTNTTGYRYYRITVPGATSASPFLREIEFKIDDA